MSNLAALSDEQIIARTLDGEAGNQGYNGQQAVGSVIQTRTILNWQKETTARGVCLHRLQFDCWLPGKDRARIMVENYIEPTPLLQIADLVLKQLLPDNTLGATHYFDDSIEAPSWASPDKFTVRIGRLNFYNLQ